MKPSAPASRWAIALLIALTAAPVFSALAGQPFYVFLLSKMMILALAGVSLNWILGYGNMPSFGHAGFLGIGAYSVAIMSMQAADAQGGWLASAFVQLPVATLAAAIAAIIIGAVSLRTRGVYFIMITLAFGQMLFTLGVALEPLGGDDGMILPMYSTLGPADLSSGPVLYYVVLGLLVLALIGSHRLMQSPFGAVIRGAKSNEPRLQALGVPTYRYRLAAFALAGAVCGLAGALLANQGGYVSPALAAWTHSAELVVIVLLGGAGTLFGPLFGALAVVGLEEILSQLTVHWRIIFGPLLILVVLANRGGISGLFRARSNV
jgi:branched-chain amino acid transport system permease protein